VALNVVWAAVGLYNLALGRGRTEEPSPGA